MEIALKIMKIILLKKLIEITKFGRNLNVNTNLVFTSGIRALVEHWSLKGHVPSPNSHPLNLQINKTTP
jgi:hypothetical protein